MSNKVNKREMVYKSTAELVPYVNNSRTHSETQVKQIAASIREFGFNNPILVDPDGGVIAGHGRLEAAGLLGLDEVPVVVLDGLSDAQRKAYVIADNKLALNAGWDEELLKLEIEDLGDDLTELLGFDADELNLLFNGWETDIELPDQRPDEDPTGERITIRVGDDLVDMAREKISNALDQAGISFEYA